MPLRSGANGLREQGVKSDLSLPVRRARRTIFSPLGALLLSRGTAPTPDGSGGGKIGNLDVSIVVDQDVTGLNVPVDNSALVQVVQAASDLPRDADKLLDGERLRAGADGVTALVQ